MKHQRLFLLLAAPLLATGAAFSAGLLGGSSIVLPHTFQAGTPARASEVNENFATLVSGVDNLAGEIDARLSLSAQDLDALSARTSTLETRIEGLSSPENVIVVSPSGADFTSVAEALSSITDATETNRYVVLVGPGIYEETDLCTVGAFVTLKGTGTAASVVRSERVASAAGVESSTVRLLDEGAIEDIRIENRGALQISTAIAGRSLGRSTRISNVVARADGDGGLGHFAIHVEDSDLTLADSVLFASGASVVNTAFGCIDGGGAFAQPLLHGCELEGDGSTTGMGMQLSSTAAQVEGCRIQGDLRGVSTNSLGITRIRDSEVRTLGLNPVYEQTGSATILSGGVLFIGGQPLGLATQFKYTWCIKANFDPVDNGFGSDL